MNFYYNLLLLALLIGLGSNATAQHRAAHFNLSQGVAIEGYDPVAYFTEQKAVKGREEFAVKADGVTYYCANKANQQLLLANYARYEPQYGGWCAYAMAYNGEKVPIDPQAFKIVNGKLYLFYNTSYVSTLSSWNKDEANLMRLADRQWADLLK